MQLAITWFVAPRSLRKSGGTPPVIMSDTTGGFKERDGTTGPLTSSAIDTSRVSAQNIGILGDAGPGDLDEAILGS